MSQFPQGIASGHAFCDRRAERVRLADAVREGRHTWLMAPRRYGKTSLVHRVLADLAAADAPPVTASADLLVAHDARAVADTLLATVAAAGAEVLGSGGGLVRRLGRFFSGLQPEVALGTDGVRIRFRPSEIGTASLRDALTGLDAAAVSRRRRVVLVLDEFQQVGVLRESGPVEAAIRHAAERARATTFLFSGSHRRLLARMFEDAGRPLYLLCERLDLDRIPAAEYAPFLDRAARRRWKAKLDPAARDALLDRTARHPYYVNALCARLWRAERAPDARHVDDAWVAYVEEEAPRVAAELASLSPNQRAVLAGLARHPTAEPRSREFLERTRVASASAGQALGVLLDRDLVLRDDQGVYRVLDPVAHRRLGGA